MAVKTKDTVELTLLNDTPLKREVEELSLSLFKIAKQGRKPWIHIESLSFTEVLLPWIASLSKKTVEGICIPKEGVEALKPEGILGAETGRVRVEKSMSYGSLLAALEEAGMSRVKRVWSSGEFSVIGDVLTVWPFGERLPYRVEVEDDVVAGIHQVDVETWKVTHEMEQIFLQSGDSNLPEGSRHVVVQGSGAEGDPISVVCSDTGIVPSSIRGAVTVVDCPMRSVIWGEKQVKELGSQGWKTYFVLSHKLDEAQDLLEDIPGGVLLEGSLPTGFSFPKAKCMVFSDKEVWETVRLSRKRARGTFADLVLEDITPGEYVVHEDHGVAVYAGIRTIEKEGKEDQYLELRYAEKDRLYVPLGQVKRVTKYIGAGGASPRLTRLGGGEWRRIKKRVKEAVRKLAGELLRLYAVRELTPVAPVSEHELEIASFEDEFPFVETDDQLRAIEDIKEDFRQEKPMDRLLVGDVGFGKTEVAMRAAYIAVRSGRQVAVLAPTTVLVEQHFRVFTDRFNKHGVVVEALSRFLSDDQARTVVSRIKSGAVDIVVGTHRLLSSDIDFKNLGLVIVDEEQKFGVAQKEKLKGKRVDTHVLSMTATPIPRTLNMALSGVRDISVLATPPEGRKPIENTVEAFKWELVKDAIEKEIRRDGQVYYVHNRVTTINTVREKLSELIPDVRIAVGHGQMSPQALSKVMRDFLNGLYDVLLCTTIIENGLDMERVNTLIVEHAEMFGLSQLYQIRGRIGRGAKQAYAYFLYHGVGERFVKKSIDSDDLDETDVFLDAQDVNREKSTGPGLYEKELWEDARDRLDAILQLKELGSGFALAQRDMEIRGAGSFLGREQHGNVNAVGFGLYCSLLDEMIEELRSDKSQKQQ